MFSIWTSLDFYRSVELTLGSFGTGLIHCFSLSNPMSLNLHAITGHMVLHLAHSNKMWLIGRSIHRSICSLICRLSTLIWYISCIAIRVSAELHSSVGSVADLRTGGSMVRSPARQVFFPRVDDSHCDSIYSSLTAVRCFDNGYVGRQPVTWKECCAEYWLKKNSRKA